jgi:hypothetical protein
LFFSIQRCETEQVLKTFKLRFRSIDAKEILAPNDVLMVGKGGLDRGDAPDISRVRDGFARDYF